MRVNIYAEEMTDKIEIIGKEIERLRAARDRVRELHRIVYFPDGTPYCDECKLDLSGKFVPQCPTLAMLNDEK